LGLSQDLHTFYNSGTIEVSHHIEKYLLEAGIMPSIDMLNLIGILK